MAADGAQAELAVDEEAIAPTLSTLPSDAIFHVFASLDVASLGRVASTSAIFAERVDEGAWQNIARSQGLLHAPAAACKAAIKKAAECTHHLDRCPFSDFVWRAIDQVPEASQFVVGTTLDSKCPQCHRCYTVTLAVGFVDTPSFSSKLVTCAIFDAMHAAPRHHRTFEYQWDRMAASDLRQQLSHAASRAASARGEKPREIGWTFVSGQRFRDNLPRPAVAPVNVR